MAIDDLLLRSVLVVTPGQDEPTPDDIAVSDGRILAIGRGVDAPAGAEIVDGQDHIAFPGVVDAHQHWGIYNDLEEDAAAESLASAQGGATSGLTYIRTGQLYLEKGGPYGEFMPEVETDEEVRRSESLVVEALQQTDPGRFDAFLPDCVLDPGAESVGPVPVLGLLRLSSHLLGGLGQPFSAVARNGAIADELGRRLALYGMAEQCPQVRVLGLSVTDIEDEATWAQSVAAAVADLEVGAVVNGCSAVDVLPAGGGPRVLDPTATATATALQVLGLVGDLRLLPHLLAGAR